MGNRIYDEMITMDGPSINLVIERTVNAQDRDGLSTTVSAEAMSALIEQMRIWVVTRVIRHEQSTGLMPQTIAVQLTVDVTA